MSDRDATIGAMNLPVSLAVITRNEAASIGRCLDSVPFADDKLVVDCGSEDDTVAVARAHGARVVQQDWLGFGPQRNFASGQCRHDWILVLDADEFLSEELAAEMQQRLPQIMASTVPAAILRRRSLFMGRPMRWYRPATGETLARLYHRDRARWSDVRVHESLQFEGAAARFRAPFEHSNNPTLVHKQLKVLLYSELKCRDRNERGRPPAMWQTPLVYFSAFLKDYLLRLAFLDGWRGYIIAQTAASYAVYKRMRQYEMSVNPASVDLAARALERHNLEQN